MKKLLIAVVSIIAALYISNTIYQAYSCSHVNEHEAVVLINDRLQDKDVDEFFGISKGTYNPAKHIIRYSLPKKDGSVLDRYVALPAKRMYGHSFEQGLYDCNISYKEVEHLGFYNYEISNYSIIARLVDKDASANRQLQAPGLIAEKHLSAAFEFGIMNIVEIDKDLVSTVYCR